MRSDVHTVPADQFSCVSHQILSYNPCHAANLVKVFQLGDVPSLRSSRSDRGAIRKSQFWGIVILIRLHFASGYEGLKQKTRRHIPMESTRINGLTNLPRCLFPLALALVALCTHGYPQAPSPAQGKVDQVFPAGSKRPTNVPEGYVVTPNGYFHPSCVRHLAQKDHVMSDGRIQHIDGSIDGAGPVCAYPRYTRAGFEINPNAVVPTTEVSGWLENANVSTGLANWEYGSVVSIFKVPVYPASNDGQFLYYFPGLEDINGVQSILQPVLAYNNGQWTMANWNCCLSGTTDVSPAITVLPGENILTMITNTCKADTTMCPTWNVFSMDLVFGGNSELSLTPSDSQIFNWAFGGVLEPYYVVSCQDFPTGQFTFTTVLFDQKLNPVAEPQWTPVQNQMPSLPCTFGITASRETITLTY
jgi:hypothetical protein